MKYGLEIEFFAKRKKTYIDAGLSGLPHDEYPLLVEARGGVSTDIYQAIGSVRAEIKRILAIMAEKKIKPAFDDWAPREDPSVKAIRTEILRRGITKRVSHQNITGLVPSEMNDTHFAAGMHISFTNPQSHGSYYTSKDCNDRTDVVVNSMFDFPQIFLKISNEFKKEIEAAKRTPGFYELKSDGRIEYRSLPATLIHDRNFDYRLAKCLP